MAQRDKRKLIVAKKLSWLPGFFYLLSTFVIFPYALYIIWGNNRSYTENKWYGWIVEQGHLLPFTAFGLLLIATVIRAYIIKLEWPFQYSLEQKKKYDHSKILKIALVVGIITVAISELSLLMNGVITVFISGGIIFMFSPFLKSEPN